MLNKQQQINAFETKQAAKIKQFNDLLAISKLQALDFSEQLAESFYECVQDRPGWYEVYMEIDGKQELVKHIRFSSNQVIINIGGQNYSKNLADIGLIIAIEVKNDQSFIIGTLLPSESIWGF